jgi:hypothetical protein
MMPDHLEWPRSVSAEYPDKGERPLHFVAQIACADFPAELWGGFGSRDGWLLLFIDPNQGAPDGPDAFRVLHIDTLGPERQHPDDLGPVHDGMYTGPTYDYCRTIDDVPKLWRRWPVDLVVVPNQAQVEGQRTRVAPENFANILYAGQPVAPDRDRPADPEPFTWRGALYVLDGIDRSLARPLGELRIPPTLLEKLNRPGYIPSILAAREADDAKWMEASRPWLEGPDPDDAAERDRRARIHAAAENRKAGRDALAAFLADHDTPDSILEHLRESDRRHRAWRAAAREHIAGARSAVLVHELDSQIPAEAWRALKARLARDTFRFMNYRWVERDGDSLHVSFDEIEISLLDRRRSGIGELVADYYVDDAKRSLIPPELLPEYEPHWRSLYDNRPHRIGGYHDGLQSDAEIGPASELLLFQIVTDDAMHWCWGDAGAYYVFLDVDALKTSDYARARMTLECH